uniref:Uncharacterized protein n=1 Tax=Romanomermis culicivorax TaxID=13658 RepID=A0A915K119_ROMCU
FGAERPGAKVAGTEIAGTETASTELAGTQTTAPKLGRRSWATEMAAPKKWFRILAKCFERCALQSCGLVQSNEEYKVLRKSR